MKTLTNLWGKGILLLFLIIYSSCGSNIFVANFEGDDPNQLPNVFPPGNPNNDRIEFPDNFEPSMRVYAWETPNNPTFGNQSLRMYNEDLDGDLNRISSLKLVPTRKATNKKKYSISYVINNQPHGDQYANELETHVMAAAAGAPAVSVVLRDRLKLFVNGVEIYRWGGFGSGSLYIYILIDRTNSNFKVGYKHTQSDQYTFSDMIPLVGTFDTLDHVLMRYSTPGPTQEAYLAGFYLDKIVIKDYK